MNSTSFPIAPNFHCDVSIRNRYFAFDHCSGHCRVKLDLDQDNTKLVNELKKEESDLNLIVTEIFHSTSNINYLQNDDKWLDESKGLQRSIVYS